jgi:hypothetical protein
MQVIIACTNNKLVSYWRWIRFAIEKLNVDIPSSALPINTSRQATADSIATAFKLFGNPEYVTAIALHVVILTAMQIL